MIVFLDFDGVLHPAPPHNNNVGVLCYLERFESIMRDFPEWRIVISSSWREQFDLETLRGFFSDDISDRIIGVTPVIALTTPQWRQREIEWYLHNANQSSAQWIAIDDMPGNFKAGLSNLVLCHMECGIDDRVETELRTKLMAISLVMQTENNLESDCHGQESLSHSIYPARTATRN